MKHFVLLLLVFVELACSHTPAPSRKSVYGDPGPNTIAVTVGWGFYFRGTYHLPAGAKVGLLDLFSDNKQDECEQQVTVTLPSGWVAGLGG